jgi:hypothetical protein
MILMLFSEDCGRMIHEKNQTQKSRDTVPFNEQDPQDPETDPVRIRIQGSYSDPHTDPRVRIQRSGLGSVPV